MSNVLKLLALLAAAAAPSALLAQPTQQRFTRDGATFVYTVSTDRAGHQVIEGRRLPSGSAFRLTVAGDRVDGVSGGQPVAFRVPARASAELLAAR